MQYRGVNHMYGKLIITWNDGAYDILEECDSLFLKEKHRKKIGQLYKMGGWHLNIYDSQGKHACSFDSKDLDQIIQFIRKQEK